MHQYSTDSKERLRVPIRLGIGAVLIVYLIQWGLSAADVTLPWWLAAPGILGVYWGIFEFFDRWLWRWPFIRLITGVEVPDIHGAWEGVVRQTSEEGSGERATTVDIKQRWNSISVALATGESTSRSHVAGFETVPAGEHVFVYEYLNVPRGDAVDTMEAHRGFARVELQKSGAQVSRLHGDYFTGRGRRTFGVIDLERKV